MRMVWWRQARLPVTCDRRLDLMELDKKGWKKETNIHSDVRIQSDYVYWLQN